MERQRVVVVGAGVAGLVASVELAARGLAVTLLERAESPGGKMREVAVGGQRIDAGPTVLTMRGVFDEVFAAGGARLDEFVTLEPLEILARHAWSDRERLDLHADLERSVEAIGELCGAAEAKRYRGFCREARAIHDTLEGPFLRSLRPGPLGLVSALGLRRLPELWRIRPFATLWRALGDHFHDPRLRQLFGRYATYVGSSPFQAPATLMLIAHVEQAGVWTVRGGMHRLARALADLATKLGVCVRTGAEVAAVEVGSRGVSGVRLADGEPLAAERVVMNADVAALAEGRFGPAVSKAVPACSRRRRSLSALTWTLLARTDGFPLLRHSVFFSPDYAAEFDDLLKRSRLPRRPTVYVCAQDRGGRDGAAPGGPERLLCLVNAPPVGDARAFPLSEIESCEERTFERLERCGLRVQWQRECSVTTSPADFERLFPATGGALYGAASHGWQASFRRPSARSRLPGLYLAGGSTHPGAGVPMAALSGRLAAGALLEDLASTSRSHPAATSGGTSTP